MSSGSSKRGWDRNVLIGSGTMLTNDQFLTQPLNVTCAVNSEPAAYTNAAIFLKKSQ